MSPGGGRRSRPPLMRSTVGRRAAAGRRRRAAASPGSRAWEGGRVSGDEEFDRFCVDAWPRLVAALTLYCGDVHVAEEIAQEALLRAYRRWPTVAAFESPGGWAYRVGINLANSLLRRKQAESRARRRLANDRPAAWPRRRPTCRYARRWRRCRPYPRRGGAAVLRGLRRGGDGRRAGQHARGRPGPDPPRPATAA